MYQQNPLLMEGMGLSRAGWQFDDCDPDLLAYIGPDAHKQYGHSNFSIKVMYGKMRDDLESVYGVYQHKTIITCTPELEEPLRKLFSTFRDIAELTNEDDRAKEVIWKIVDKETGHVIKRVEETYDPKTKKIIEKKDYTEAYSEK